MARTTKKIKAQPTPDDTVVTLQQAQASEVIPVEHRIELKALGQNWFKNDRSGVCYRLGRQNEGDVLSVLETRQSIKKAPLATRVSITCIVCGDKREVATQDAFQVKRCVECQTVYVKGRRAERAKERRLERKAVQPPVQPTVN